MENSSREAQDHWEESGTELESCGSGLTWCLSWIDLNLKWGQQTSCNFKKYTYLEK